MYMLCKCMFICVYKYVYITILASQVWIYVEPRSSYYFVNELPNYMRLFSKSWILKRLMIVFPLWLKGRFPSLPAILYYYKYAKKHCWKIPHLLRGYQLIRLHAYIYFLLWLVQLLLWIYIYDCCCILFLPNMA